MDKEQSGHEQEHIVQECETALSALRDYKEGKGIPTGTEAREAIERLLEYLPETNIRVEDYGLTQQELPTLVAKYATEKMPWDNKV